MRWNYRLVSALLVLTSIIGISFALYLEHVQGLEPCPLCVFQRIGLIGMGFIALIAFIHNPISNGFKRFYALLATLSIGWSAGVAARHVWLQNLPPDQVPSCDPGLDYLVSFADENGFTASLNRFWRMRLDRLDFFRSVVTCLVFGIF